MDESNGNGSPAYADVLRSRLRRIRAELEAQGRQAIAKQQSVLSTRQEVDSNKEELEKLRLCWAAQQPQREALIRETGAAQLQLVEEERRCSEAWANYVSSGSGHPPTPSATTLLDPLRIREQERDQKQKIASIEDSRTKLVEAVGELKSVQQQDMAEIGQLQTRIEVLRNEARALGKSAEAVQESEDRLKQRNETLDVTAVAGQQRHAALARQVTDLSAEVQNLRGELAVVSTTAGIGNSANTGGNGIACSHIGSSRAGERRWKGEAQGVATTKGGTEDGAPVYETNRRLNAKVDALQEELGRKRALVQCLRERLAGDVQVEAGEQPGHDVFSRIEETGGLTDTTAPSPAITPAIREPIP